MVGSVATPWAYDARGEAVPTWYRIDGSTLVQVISAGQEAVYPIVADPSISYGWRIYVRYSAAEVKTQVTGWRGAVNDKAKYAALVCVFIPNIFAAAACGLLSYDVSASIVNTAKSAYARGRGMEIQYLYNGVPVSWKVY